MTWVVTHTYNPHPNSGAWRVGSQLKKHSKSLLQKEANKQIPVPGLTRITMGYPQNILFLPAEKR